MCMCIHYEWHNTANCNEITHNIHIQERVTEKNSLEDRIESLEKQLSEEMAARRILEARVAQQRHECDHRVKDAMQEVCVHVFKHV
jgi:hypothetical protein